MYVTVAKHGPILSSARKQAVFGLVACDYAVL